MLGQDQRGDQEAGDDEENVDTDEAAGPAGHTGMEGQHRHDRDRPQPVDVGAVDPGWELIARAAAGAL